MDRTEERLAYGIESNSTLLECTPRSLQAKVIWFVQKGREMRREEVTHGYTFALGVLLGVSRKYVNWVFKTKPHGAKYVLQFLEHKTPKHGDVGLKSQRWEGREVILWGLGSSQPSLLASLQASEGTSLKNPP